MTFPAKNVTVSAKIRDDWHMTTLEPITVSATVLAQMYYTSTRSRWIYTRDGHFLTISPLVKM